MDRRESIPASDFRNASMHRVFRAISRPSGRVPSHWVSRSQRRLKSQYDYPKFWRFRRDEFTVSLSKTFLQIIIIEAADNLGIPWTSEIKEVRVV